MIVGARAPAPEAATESSVTATVDFAEPVQRTDPYAIGLVASTYGATPVTSAAQSLAEQTLDARNVRIPVGVRNGVVTSSATGVGYVDVPALVARYRSWGFHVLAVVGGRTNDFDVQPGDATRIFQALGFVGVDYTGPNEPGNGGHTLAQVLSVDRMILSEGRALNPAFTLWGPVWSYYDSDILRSFATDFGSGVGGLDYHHYGMGVGSISTAELMSSTPTWGAEVAAARTDLGALGLPPRVNVDEVNMSWRYDDGTTAADGGDGQGGNARFFTAVNTVFLASVCGHVLVSGGLCMPYASQNGPLGMTVEAGQLNPDNRPAGTPMPGYWGIAAWTGADMWPHMNDTFYQASTSDPSLEAFAVNNEAGGYNVVLINKSGTSSVSLSLELDHLPRGTFRRFQTHTAAPYAAPGLIDSGAYDRTLSLGVDPMSVSVVVLDPDPPAESAPRPLYRISAAGDAVGPFVAPGGLAAGGTAVSNPGVTIPPSGVPSEVFDAARVGAQTYTLPVTGSSPVQVRLVFAERSPPAQAPGARRFDIAINDKQIATNYDIWQHQGEQSTGFAIVTRKVRPASGAVVIALRSGAAGIPTINAILVDTL